MVVEWLKQIRKIEQFEWLRSLNDGAHTNHIAYS